MSPESDVASDIPYTRVYGGPLEEFVKRRDALMRELRSAGDRDAANAVKALRKPSRIAWALDQGAITAQDAFDALVAAAAATLEAQTAGGDVRCAAPCASSLTDQQMQHATPATASKPAYSSMQCSPFWADPTASISSVQVGWSKCRKAAASTFSQVCQR